MSIKIFGILSDVLLALEIIITIFFIIKKIKKPFRELLFVLICCISAFILATFLKKFYPYPRPLTLITNIQKFDSFPSRHSLIASSLMTATFYLNKKLFLLNLVLTVIIGSFRILSLYHWPHDVLAGWILGVLIAILIKNLIFNFKREVI